MEWKWPEKYGEDKMVVMFGGVHIEMAALKTLDDWLRGSGWVQALVQAEIATPGKADSFLRAAHGTRTRRAHQITATALHILQHPAYERHPLLESFRLDFEGDVSDSDFSSWQINTHLPVGQSCVRRCRCDRSWKLLDMVKLFNVRQQPPSGPAMTQCNC